MRLKLTLQVIKPSESYPLEIWCPPEMIPFVPVMDGSFFESFLMNDFSEEVWDFFNTEFEDILCEMISSISFAPRARYHLSDAYDEFRKLALTEVKRMAKKYRAIYIFTDEDKNNELFRSELDLVYLMEKWVNNRENDCQRCIDVGEAMINGMEQFVTSASWHSAWIYEGTNKKPIMWFGLSGERPEEGWILNVEDDHETGYDWSTFWLCEDSWTDWQNRVSDADDVFLTWMTAECDMSLPELASIVITCPIDIDEKDDYCALTQKIREYINLKEKR